MENWRERCRPHIVSPSDWAATGNGINPIPEVAAPRENNSPNERMMEEAMDTNTQETLDTDTIENLDMNDKMPAEIKGLIIDAFDKYCAEQREKEQDKARERDIKRAEWKEYNKTVKGLLPLCLREFMVEKEDEERSPHNNQMIARIEVPGLAPIIINLATNTIIVSVPKRNHHDGFSTSEDWVSYHFPDYAISFHLNDLGAALLSARRAALHFKELFAEIELEKQEFAKMQAEREKANAEREARGPEPVYEATDETVNNALVEGIRTLIREELAKVV